MGSAYTACEFCAVWTGGIFIRNIVRRGRIICFLDLYLYSSWDWLNCFVILLQALYFCVPFREQLLEYYANNKSASDGEENMLTCLADLFSQVPTIAAIYCWKLFILPQFPSFPFAASYTNHMWNILYLNWHFITYPLNNMGFPLVYWGVPHQSL